MPSEDKISPSEQKALEDGWLPKDEWVEHGNDEGSWVDYKEFNFRGELMDRISQQTKSIKSRDKDIADLRVAIKELTEHNKKVAEAEYKRAITDLKQQKLQAAKDENQEAVIAIEERIDDLKEQEAEFKKSTDVPKEPQSTTPSEFVDWVRDKKNSWYMTDRVMQGAANALITEFEENNPGGSPSEALAYLDEKIKEEFPHKFKSEKRLSKRIAKVNEPGANGSGQGAGGKSKFSLSDLSDEQRAFAKTFALHGALSEQEYVDQLAELGELPSQQRG